MSVFVAGAGIPQSSINYINYIESNGTQYIDTGFKPNQDTRIVIDFQLMSSELEQTPFLARTSSISNSFGIFYPSNGWTADYGDQRIVVNTALSSTEKILLDFNKNNINMNNYIASFNIQTFVSPVNLFLLVRNTNGTLSNYAKARLYSCKIYDNNILIRDYYPCVDENGVVCLYDKVNKEYVYNSGTGEFIGG